MNDCDFEWIGCGYGVVDACLISYYYIFECTDYNGTDGGVLVGRLLVKCWALWILIEFECVVWMDVTMVFYDVIVDLIDDWDCFYCY